MINIPGFLIISRISYHGLAAIKSKERRAGGKEKQAAGNPDKSGSSLCSDRRKESFGCTALASEDLSKDGHSPSLSSW